MVERSSGGSTPLPVNDLRTAYDCGGAAWASGASLLYDRLAVRIIQTSELQLCDALVLDAGAGTGAVSRALAQAQALPVALDISADMLAHAGDAPVHAVVGDILSLPFPDDTFDAAVSAFAISHVGAPERALAEMGRVVRPSGPVVASVFGAAPPSVAKDVIYEVAMKYGYEPPAWYVHLKNGTEPLSNTPERLMSVAHSGGFADAVVTDIAIDSGLETAEQVVAYRTGMAQLAPFVASLAEDQREQFLRDAVAAVRARSQALLVRVLILSSHAPSYPFRERSGRLDLDQRSPAPK